MRLDLIRKIVRRGEHLQLPAKPYVLLLSGRARRARYVLCDDGGHDDAEMTVWLGVCMGDFANERYEHLIREVKLGVLTWL